MKLLIFLLSTIVFTPDTPPLSFRQNQMAFTRVREAYSAKEKTVVKTLAAHSINRDSLNIYLRVFKNEMKMELWAKNSSDSAYEFIKFFPICDISGDIGPKRQARDLQVPEGFYHISNINPYSKYYLSLQINYPNASDSIRGVKGHLGNLIFIHGGSESSGCIAITDEQIKELVVYCIEAYNSGQKQIDITIFPADLNELAYARLMKAYKRDSDKTSLWHDLKKHYDQFSLTKTPPPVRFLLNGNHDFVRTYKYMKSIDEPILIK